MTDETQDLQAEIDSLREHNAKLLNEKKAATAQVTKLETERDKLTAQIEQRDQAPINEVFESLAGENFAGYLRQEFGRDFQASKNDDGKLEIRDLDDNPVELDGEPCAFTAANIRKLATDREMTNLNSLILATQNGGGGAQAGSGMRTATQPDNRKKTSEKSQFGLR